MQTFKDYYSLKSSVEGLDLDLAISKEEQRQGLMGVEFLPQNKGMLFIYQEPTRMSFWMKNTKIPLDIAYIDDVGVIKEIHHLQPNDETHVLSNCRCKYALEVNRGWFSKNDYKVGDHIIKLF